MFRFKFMIQGSGFITYEEVDAVSQKAASAKFVRDIKKSGKPNPDILMISQKDSNGDWLIVWHKGRGACVR